MADVHTNRLKVGDSWGTPMIYLVDHGNMIQGGFAVLELYSGPQAGQQRFFEWRTCDHEFKSRTIANCLNRFTCQKCGAVYEVDSSD